MAQRFTAAIRDLSTQGAPCSRRSLALTWMTILAALEKIFPGCPKKHRENFACGPTTND
jgi:hypothetical protein